MAKLVAALDARSARPLYWSLVGPLVRFNLTLVHGLAAVSGAGSRLLRYSASSRHRDSGVLVRSRNPRLFANVNGKDLLVEYVEGESAGKAFLSRASTGTYLGEGYNFHSEGVRLSLSQAASSATSSQAAASSTSPKVVRSDLPGEAPTYILMMTFERVLLLIGALNASFCDVVWDAHFADVVYVEVLRDAETDEPSAAGDSSVTSPFLAVTWWYLQSSSRGLGRDERISRAFVSDVGGLDALESRQMYLPRECASQLLSKLRETSPTWIDPAVLTWLDLTHSQSNQTPPPRRATLMLDP
jgi:hypothetical protein